MIGRKFITSVLLAEDDPDLLLLLQDCLVSEGLVVYPVGNGLDAYRLFIEKKPDIAVLDIDMPGIDGLKLCAQIRKQDSLTPIIFTSGFSKTDDIKKGFEAGANDYLKKPFDVDELIIRIEHLIQKMPVSDTDNNIFHLGAYLFDSGRHKLSHSGTGTDYFLPYTENALLSVLCQQLGKIVLRDTIIELVWDKKPAIDSRSIDVHISKLRKLLAQDKHISIINCYSKGYRLVVGD